MNRFCNDNVEINVNLLYKEQKSMQNKPLNPKYSVKLSNLFKKMNLINILNNNTFNPQQYDVLNNILKDNLAHEVVLEQFGKLIDKNERKYNGFFINNNKIKEIMKNQEGFTYYNYEKLVYYESRISKYSNLAKSKASFGNKISF